MFKFFFVILPLIVLFFIFLFGFSVLRGIFRLFFGGGGQPRNVQTDTKRERRPSNPSPPKHNKAFSKNEGEYVDYEEIKD